MFLRFFERRDGGGALEHQVRSTDGSSHTVQQWKILSPTRLLLGRTGSHNDSEQNSAITANRWHINVIKTLN